MPCHMSRICALNLEKKSLIENTLTSLQECSAKLAVGAYPHAPQRLYTKICGYTGMRITFS